MFHLYICNLYKALNSLNVFNALSLVFLCKRGGFPSPPSLLAVEEKTSHDMPMMIKFELLKKKKKKHELGLGGENKKGQKGRKLKKLQCIILVGGALKGYVLLLRGLPVNSKKLVRLCGGLFIIRQDSEASQ